MSDSSPSRPARVPALAWVLVGVVLGAAAWLLPVNLKSVTPALLEAAGQRTPGVAALGEQLLDAEKIGPTALVLATAEAVDDPRASRLAERFSRERARMAELAAWGGWDPFLDPLFNLKENTGRFESTPVLVFFITTDARTALRGYLANSRSQGVQAVLATREIDRTKRFVPAARPGGQTLDAVIMLTALLYQGEHLSASLQREVRALADAAVAAKELGDLELFYLDLLSLGRRLDWVQLSELLRRSDSVKTVGEFAHLGRVAPDELPLIYTASLFSSSADGVAAFLLRYGRAGVDDLRMALGFGQGAVRQLLLRQVPVNRGAGLSVGAAAEFGLVYPKAALGLKYLGFLAGAFCLFRGLEILFLVRSTLTSLPRMSGGVLALLTAALLVLATEPYLLKAAPLSEFQIKFTIPVLANVADPESLQSTPATLSMDSRTLFSIGFFAALQVGMYVICLMKISEISRQALTPLVKLRLMENEENLFDGGLYLGIGGTAAALVFQVLGLIEPNLLAAYSSNLFGITCVALVKIRHVRPYKYQLIMESQAAAVPSVVVQQPVAQ